MSPLTDEDRQLINWFFEEVRTLVDKAEGEVAQMTKAKKPRYSQGRAFLMHRGADLDTLRSMMETVLLNRGN